jgi:hypothetical protein
MNEIFISVGALKEICKLFGARALCKSHSSPSYPGFRKKIILASVHSRASLI